MLVFDTPRLVLRRLEAGDADFILALPNDPDWIRFIGVGVGGVRSPDDARAYRSLPGRRGSPHVPASAFAAPPVRTMPMLSTLRVLPLLSILPFAFGCDASADAAHAARASDAAAAEAPASRFGDGGVARAEIGPGARMMAVAAQPDGKIVAVGSVKADGTDVFAVARFAADGSLDPRWGARGVAATRLAERDHHALAVAVQPDGKVVVAGAVPASGAYRFALARYLADGSPDAGFGEGGHTVTPFRYDVQPAAVVVQPDGRIVVAGTASDYDGTYFALARYGADGSLDTSFGTEGKVTTTYTGFAYGMVPQPEGGVFVAGTSILPSGTSMGGVRYGADGRLDRAFGSDGRAWTRLESVSTGEAVLLQPDGKLVVAGTTKPGGETARVALVRFAADGSLDTGFGEGGKATVPIEGAEMEVHAALQEDGRIVVATAVGGEFRLARLLPDGAADASFGEGGIARLAGAQRLRARGVVVQGARIVAAGYHPDGWILAAAER